MLIPKVRVHRVKNSRTFFVEFRSNGHRYRWRIGEDYGEAHKVAFEIRQLLMAGKDPQVEMNKERIRHERQSGQLREFWPYFEREHLPTLRPKTREQYRYLMDTIKQYPIARMPICEIFGRATAQYQQQRKDKVSPTTINHEVKLIKSMLGRAVDWEILDRDPRPTIKLLKESNRRDVSNIKPEQIIALLESLPSTLANISAFALYTGIRKESILGLKIDQVQLPDIGGIGTVQIEAKGGGWTAKGIGPQAAKILRKAIGNRTEGYVFQSPKGERYKSIHKTFDRHVRELGIVIVDGRKFCFHDWRRLYATFMLNAGRNIEEVRDALGQKSNAVAKLYATFIAGDPWEPAKLTRKEG